MNKSLLLKNILIAILLFACNIAGNAQDTGNQSEKEYAKNPIWIKMMDDPGVNYFEALKAYDIFWKRSKKPLEEDEIIGRKLTGDDADKHHDSWISRLFSKKEDKELQNEYAFLCKKFEHWKLKSEPWVKPDGKILNAEERLEVWKKSKQ